MIYDRIKKLCEAQGITIMECEKRAGLGNGVISGWKTSSPRLDKIKAVAAVLNTTVNDLIAEDKE